MFVVSVIVFALVRLSGDPIQIMMPAEASKADIELMRAHLGLDRPWAVQYWRLATPAPPGDVRRPVRFRRTPLHPPTATSRRTRPPSRPSPGFLNAPAPPGR